MKRLFETENQPRISRLLLGVTWLEVAILLWAGLGLLLWPPLVESVWPWPLAPFNLRYLGALYSAALIAALLQAISGRWSPARVVTPMIFIFTLLVTLFSFAHLERFDPQKPQVWIWFILYIGVCLNAMFHLWRYRNRLPPETRPQGVLRNVLMGLTLVLGSYGIALLLAPALASSFWPWRLVSFHAQLYSVTFITPALGAWLLLRGSDRHERITLGLTLAAWGALPILGLLLADAETHLVEWGNPDTKLWLSLFTGMAISGGWLAIGCRMKKPISSARFRNTHK